MQYALPFPVASGQPRTMNNRGMARNPIIDFDGSKENRELTDSELTRTSDRKRGTFDAKPTSGRAASQRTTREKKPQTPTEAAQKLRNKALRLLTTREHSREELLRKLAQAKARNAKRNAEAIATGTEHREARGSADRCRDDIESLVDQLAAQGWQSDDRYAEALVRRLTGQASKRFIAEKLAQAGIKKDVAQLAIEVIDDDDRDVALALWTRRYGDMPVDEKDRQRQIRFLLSRGFHLSDAFKIVPKSPRVIEDDDESRNKWSKE